MLKDGWYVCVFNYIYISGSRDRERDTQPDHLPHKDFGFRLLFFLIFNSLSDQKTRYQSTVKGGSLTSLPLDIIC